MAERLPMPSQIILHAKSRKLEIEFDQCTRFDLPFEFLRVYSPSAEVRGHGPGQEVLQVGKREVVVESIEPVGQYAIKLFFSDGHDTGLFSWQYLFWLGSNYSNLWQDYLNRLQEKAASRDSTAISSFKTVDIQTPSGCND